MVPCPKEDAVKELLDRYDDVGRIVFYGGFSGSVDRIEQICPGQEWEVVRVDGRGWKASWGNVSTSSTCSASSRRDRPTTTPGWPSSGSPRRPAWD